MNGNDLINTTATSPGAVPAAAEAFQSWAYYNGLPYPAYAFNQQQWPKEKGPTPTPLPYAKILVDECAEFVFSNGSPQFSIPDSPNADELLQLVLKRNGMNGRYISVAQYVGNQGTIAAKFNFDTSDPRGPVRISFLAVPQECRVWVDPHDQSRLLMARIQYPYRDLNTGKWLYYREEWTEELYVTYEPMEAAESSVDTVASIPGYMASFGDEKQWKILAQTPNQMGLIPITLLRNKVIEGSPLGVGDCWGTFRIMDRLALTAHGEDRANQMHAEPMPVIKNARIDNPGLLLPGEPISIMNDNPDGPSADMVLLEPTGDARVYSGTYLDRMEALLYKACGMSRIDPETLSNKGNMTRLALMTAYARTVSTAERKRTNFGEDGFCRMFRDILTAVDRIGGYPNLAVDQNTDVSVEWPDYFEATDEDISNVSDRTISQMQAGVLPPARASERIALAEGIPPHEIEQMLGELTTISAKATGSGVGKGAPSEGAESGGEYAQAIDSTGFNNFSA